MIAASASAQELGRDYTRLTLPQTPGTAEKVEVLEFFSWGCSHCAEMHPLLSEWEKQLPANAVVVKVPISLGHREWGQLVRAYYALEALGELKRLEGAVFDAIHKEGQPLFTEDRIAQWLAAQGVSEQKFRAEFNSSNVSTKASRAEQLARTTGSIRRRSWRSTANMSFAARRTPTRSRSRASSSTSRRRRGRAAEERIGTGDRKEQNGLENHSKAFSSDCPDSRALRSLRSLRLLLFPLTRRLSVSRAMRSGGRVFALRTTRTR